VERKRSMSILLTGENTEKRAERDASLLPGGCPLPFSERRARERRADFFLELESGARRV